MLRYVIVTLSLLCLSSCVSMSNIIDTSDPYVYEIKNREVLYSSLQDVKTSYTNVVKLVSARQKADKLFTRSEWLKLCSFNTYTSIFLLKYESLINVNGEVDVEDLEFLVEIIRLAYKDVHPVVYAHWAQFSQTDRDVIMRLEAEITTINAKFDQLLQEEEDINFEMVLNLVMSVLMSATQMLHQTAI